MFISYFSEYLLKKDDYLDFIIEPPHDFITSSVLK
jgi:hypothetical protein